ncbi:hypothetical protein SIN8267_00438 [Sinobacterium norvegicum]|uniref:DUF1513 domain-containing protein n=1 Tax=Sinobacterium norvegicum TaxID=1641715 RepID=A0ABM9ABL4_9GAMM|nr:DUF1513 domain-containing protein [Sinobacterium norvegicum]CAH0990346.1 hypothetical protein SIN8267_00438 [Sinobacterium norvegicum]
MAINLTRRNVLKALASTGAIGLSPLSFSSVSTGRHSLPVDYSDVILSAASDGDNNHFLTAFTPQRQLLKAPLPHRGHACAINKKYNHWVFFSRRPGLELTIYDANNKIKDEVTSSENRHFFGHGCFSADQNTLYCTENAFTQASDSSTGVIGIYDVTSGYRRIGEIDCQGIGPHQLVLLPDNKTLAVAIGGILTHPSKPRQKLNLDTLHSALVFIDTTSRRVTKRLLCPEPQLSLRHLAIASNGDVIIAGQYQGEPSDNIPLLYHCREQQLHPMQLPQQQWLGFNQYIASVATSPNGIAVTTSPRANSIELWDLSNNVLLSKHRIKDCAGITWSTSLAGFILSNGSGQLLLLTLDADQSASIKRLQHHASLRWDNHLSS